MTLSHPRGALGRGLGVGVCGSAAQPEGQEPSEGAGAMPGLLPPPKVGARAAGPGGARWVCKRRGEAPQPRGEAAGGGAASVKGGLV